MQSKRTARDRAKHCADRRFALMMQLGSVCADCGEDDIDELQFDHIYGRDYQPSDLSRWQRICNLEREFKAGLIQLLCEDCNKRKGMPLPPVETYDGSIPF